MIDSLGGTEGKETGGMKPVVWSASSLSAYNQCQLRYWFTYIAALPGEDSPARADGVAAHAAFESLLRGEEPVADGIEPLVLVMREEIVPTYDNPVAIEHPFSIDVNGIPYSGIIDSVDVKHGSAGALLRDLKTTGNRPRPGSYRTNMIGYWLGAREDLGIECSGIQLDYIVKTKKPYYWPELQPAPDDLDILVFAGMVERAAEGVDQGKFEPTGLGTWVCRWCEHATSCGPLQRYNEEHS